MEICKIEKNLNRQKDLNKMKSVLWNKIKHTKFENSRFGLIESGHVSLFKVSQSVGTVKPVLSGHLKRRP